MTDGVSFHISGKDGWDVAVDALIERVSAASQEVAAKGGELVKAAAQSHAPVKQGTLRRSIDVAEVIPIGAGAWMSRTGPTVIYGRRVDLGFKGTDSLGRLYNQSGQPFMEEGFAEAGPRFESLYTEIFSAALEG